MHINDILKACKCKYAKANDDWKESRTFNVVCKLHNCLTDENHCEKCREKKRNIPKE